MKKLVMLFGAILLCIAVQACSVNTVSEISDNEISQLYYKAKEAFSWFHTGGIRCDYSDSKPLNGHPYYRVTDDRFTSINDLETYLDGIFTKQLVDELLSQDPPLFTDIDNKLYSADFVSGSNINIGEDRIEQIDRIKDGLIDIKICADVLDFDSLKKIDVAEITVTMSFTDSSWKFSKFELISAP